MVSYWQHFLVLWLVESALLQMPRKVLKQKPKTHINRKHTEKTLYYDVTYPVIISTSLHLSKVLFPSIPTPAVGSIVTGSCCHCGESPTSMVFESKKRWYGCIMCLQNMYKVNTLVIEMQLIFNDVFTKCTQFLDNFYKQENMMCIFPERPMFFV